MKMADVMKMMQDGRSVVIGQYRSTPVAGKVPYYDKETDGMKSFAQLKHRIEVGNDTLTVLEDVPRDFDGAGYKPQFKKGDAVVVEFGGKEVTRGEVTMQHCKLYSFEG